VITQSPFRISDVATLADRPDDQSLTRLIATYETQSDYGIAGRPFEVTGTTEVLVATFDHQPSETEIEDALRPVRERPQDDLLRLRYRFLRATCLTGEALSPGEHAQVTAVLRDRAAHRSLDLIEAAPMAGTVIYPPRWAPNSYARALGRAAARLDATAGAP
jgi:hypothetical protein